MSKHLIKIESTPHGVLGVRHAGKDQQYCEAGEQVILKWQPDAKWGLQEAHYIDAGGNIVPIDLKRVKVNGKDVVVFTMPNAEITVGGTFKRFAIEDWTEKKENKGKLFTVDENGGVVLFEFPFIFVTFTSLSEAQVGDIITASDIKLFGASDVIEAFKIAYNEQKGLVLYAMYNNTLFTSTGIVVSENNGEIQAVSCLFGCTTADGDSGISLRADFLVENNNLKVDTISFSEL